MVHWHLGGKGPRLNPHGNDRPALNLKAIIRKMPVKFGNLLFLKATLLIKTITIRIKFYLRS